METIKRWIILFVLVMCTAGLTACAISPTIPATPAPALTSTSVAVLPTDTLRPTDTPIPTPTLGLTTGFDDVPMVKVPAGNFIMGSTGEKIAHWEQMTYPHASAYNDLRVMNGRK